MSVRRRDLEGLLAELTREVADPRAGLFGPASMSWRITREIALLAGDVAATVDTARLRRLEGKPPDSLGRMLEQLAARSLPQVAQ